MIIFKRYLCVYYLVFYLINILLAKKSIQTQIRDLLYNIIGEFELEVRQHNHQLS